MDYRELFLDTTYVMPFFFLDIDVRGFSKSRYKKVIQALDRIHLSEVSIIEAKAKCLKLSKTKPEILEKFQEGLSILATDEKTVIHGYRSTDDKRFNALINLNLDFFDAMILSQSLTIGILLTEDSKLLRIQGPDLRVLNWVSLMKDMSGIDMIE